jgi:hypothetical protein
MAVVTSEVLARLDKLKVEHAKALQAEAVATSQYERAQVELKKAEDELRALGIDPAKAEEFLRAELERVDKEISKCSEGIAASLESYKTIAADVQAMGAVR